MIVPDSKGKKGKWLKYILIFFLGLIIGLTWLWYSTSTTYDTAYNWGYEDGFYDGYNYGYGRGLNNSEFKDNYYREYYIKNCVSSMCRENKDCITDQIIDDTKTYCTLLMANKTVDEFINELKLDFDIFDIIEEKEITPAPS